MRRFGKLTVIKEYKRDKVNRYLCVCDCGREKEVTRYCVENGITKSCGCLRKEKATTHGFSNERFYKIWKSLKRRCSNTNDSSYKWYGERGIKNLWESFEEFKEDMYKSYLEHCLIFGVKQTTIERIDNDGNYCKENCKWATRKEQVNNTRNNVVLTFKNKTQTMSQWGKELGIKPDTIQMRIKYRNWTVERALSTKT